MSAQTTADPRKACARFVHVNSPLDRAIALHRAAYGHDEEWFALQTILFAATPPSMTFARSSTMCPRFPAWAWPWRDAEAARETWLRGITRCLTWIMSEVAATHADSNAVRAE
ncbi:hypothetical protein ACVWZK_009532 [Bradyrhizobium sp. GM0.4]|uniref:hypothetical protein n=1 Tax=unclassified Bradyrhizobium TaxID=2631580 RepID=UPI001FFB5F7A|nr:MULTISPECIES: hypothetical protein [unclassified Bradyrhizobium]MCK1343655.1 hypothetical protein [Bradyrhizobium sp. CW11]MCK1589599.1 hypothetical protein [Bradyrhizobium sp. 169]